MIDSENFPMKERSQDICNARVWNLDSDKKKKKKLENVVNAIRVIFFLAVDGFDICKISCLFPIQKEKAVSFSLNRKKKVLITI